jgi:hypothetical protein
MAIRPRVAVSGGRVETWGYLWLATTYAPETARARILALWQRGDRVSTWEGNYLLLKSEPCLTDAALAPGLPLTRIVGAPSSALFSTCLSRSEREAFAPEPETVYWVEGGTLRGHPITQAEVVDPAGWLDVTQWSTLPMHALSPPAPEPELLDPVRPFDVRGALGAVGAPPQALRELQQALAARFKAGDGRTHGPPGMLGRVRDSLAGLLSRIQGPGPETAPRMQPHVEARVPSRLQSQLDSWAMRLMLATGVGRWLGRQQAEYFRKMLRFFERGDLDQALRHAIPLGDELGALLTRPLFGVPTPRPNLKLSPGGAAQARSLFGTGGLLTDLRAIYRQAFERLRDLDRIEEAAFVLSELLGAHEEAVDFLERSGRVGLALELAEARQLAPALIVRLLFRLGERERAVRVARRHGAFAEAVTLMERRDSVAAAALRLLWGNAAATSGDFVTAVEAVWPVEEGRPLVLEWLDRAIQLGGPAGARMLARKASMGPLAFSELLGSVRALAEEPSLEAAGERVAFARELLGSPSNSESAALARIVARGAVRDCALEIPGLLTRREIARLVGSGPFASDLPELPGHGSTSHTAAVDHTVAESDVGTLPLVDTIWLDDGKVLLALGEAGVRLISREGRTVAEWPARAHALVRSDHSDRVLILARAGTSTHVTLLNMRERKTIPLFDAQLTAWAPDFDGGIWFVGTTAGLQAIDMLQPGFKSLWRTAETGGRVVRIARSRASCSFLGRDVSGTDVFGRAVPRLGGTAAQARTPAARWEMHRLELPSLVLRRRSEAPPADGESLNRLVTPGCSVFDLTVVQSQDGQLLTLADPRRQMAIGNWDDSRRPLPTGCCTDGWLAAVFPEEGGMACVAAVIPAMERRLRVRLQGSRNAACSLAGPVLTLVDDRGRMFAFDLNAGRWLRDLRLR